MKKAPKAAIAAPSDYSANWMAAKACRLYGDEMVTQKSEGWKDKAKVAARDGMKYGDLATRLDPKSPEGWYWYGLNVGTYSDCVSMLTALGEGLKGKTLKSFETAYAIDKMLDNGGPILALGRFWQVLLAVGLALAALAAIGVPARADDSSAMLNAGSIVFTKSTPVRMTAEDLYVSPGAVRIRFEFQNPTAKDIETIVAFPLPDIATWDFAESAIGTVTDDAKNFIGFKAVIDGKPVAVTVEQRAFYKGKDVTAAQADLSAMNTSVVAEVCKLSPSRSKRGSSATSTIRYKSRPSGAAPATRTFEPVFTPAGMRTSTRFPFFCMERRAPL